MMQLLDILEVIVPYKHFHKLRQFVNVKLPPGFPVKLSEWEGWVLGGASVKVCLWWVILVWVHQGCPCSSTSLSCGMSLYPAVHVCLQVFRSFQL